MTRRDEGFRQLADAIILQAVYDYRRSVNRLVRKTYDAKAYRSKQEVEGFFRSDWFQVLTDLDGLKLLHNLEARLGEEVRK